MPTKQKIWCSKVFKPFWRVDVNSTTNWRYKWDGKYKVSLPGCGNPYVWILQYTNTGSGQKVGAKGTTILLRWGCKLQYFYTAIVPAVLQVQHKSTLKPSPAFRFHPAARQLIIYNSSLIIHQPISFSALLSFSAWRQNPFYVPLFFITKAMRLALVASVLALSIHLVK